MVQLVQLIIIDISLTVTVVAKGRDIDHIEAASLCFTQMVNNCIHSYFYCASGSTFFPAQ